RLETIEPGGLLGLVAGRRWFARTAHAPTSASLAAVVHEEAELELGIVEVAFADDGSARYLVALGSDGEDALDEPDGLRRLLALCLVDSPCADVRAAG